MLNLKTLWPIILVEYLKKNDTRYTQGLCVVSDKLKSVDSELVSAEAAALKSRVINVLAQRKDDRKIK